MTTPRRVNGADISHWQAKVDLAKAKASGLQFIYLKATEDENYKDPTFAARVAEARKVGLKVGAYHFARPEGGDARIEARHFISIAKPKPGDCLPVLDLEVMGTAKNLAELRNWARDFIDEVKKLIGVKPAIYGNYDLGDAAKGCVIWRPRYNDSNTPPKLAWDIWQFSNGINGVPNSFPGLGHVDLNTFRPGFKLSDFLIPKPAVVTPKPVEKPASVVETVDIQGIHLSGQFNDTDDQHIHDAKALFARAKRIGAEWVTTTEGGAGSGNWIPALQLAADDADYKHFTHPSTDIFIAVRKGFIAGDWETFVGPKVVDGVKGDRTDKKVVAVGFDTKELGRIYVGAGHLLTRGRPNPENPDWGIHTEENEAFMKAFGDYAEKVGKGSNLFFYQGDNNIDDEKDDVFLGQAKLTTAADELKNWQNTGHGPIDVIASRDGDARVKAKKFRVLDDSELKLYADHFLIEAVFTVEKLK